MKAMRYARWRLVMILAVLGLMATMTARTASATPFSAPEKLRANPCRINYPDDDHRCQPIFP
jgi:hypothetical protein